MADDDREIEPSLTVEPSLTAEELRLSERLRVAREFVGLTQDAVAKALTVPRSAVSAMEAGKRKVAFLELQQLARLYRRPLSFFSGSNTEEDLPPADDFSRALHRAAQKLSEKDRQQVLLFARFLRTASGEQINEEGEDHASQQDDDAS